MKHVIVGAGAVGLNLAEELVRRGHETVVVSRTPAPPSKLPSEATYQSLDARDAAALAAAAAGAEAIYACAGAAPGQEAAEHPALYEALIEAASRVGCGLVAFDGMDAYGDNTGIPMSEATPERPTCAAEELHASLARQVLDSHRAGRCKALIIRASTLYGPRVTRLPLGEEVFGALVAGKPARLLGRLDMPHAFTFVKDYVRAAAIAAEDGDAWGQVWHSPCPQPITQRQVLDILRDMLTRQVAFETVGSSMIGLKSMFNPALKQIAPLLYRFEKPYVVNHTRFSTTFGERTTPHTQALFETLEWYKLRAGLNRRYGF